MLTFFKFRRKNNYLVTKNCIMSLKNSLHSKNFRLVNYIVLDKKYYLMKAKNWLFVDISGCKVEEC